MRLAARDLIVSTSGAGSAAVVEHAGFGDCGSGTASFVEVSLCLSRLAPFAALLTPSDRTATSRVLPNPGRVATLPVPGWERECAAIVEVLDRHDPEPYAAFDAWFHWNDRVQLSKFGVAPRALALRPLGSSHSSCRPSGVRSR